MPKLNLPIPTLETSEGGSLAGPTSFRGYPLEAAYTLHRMGSHPPTPEQEAKMLSGDMGAHYTISLWARFKVLDVMEPVGWEGRPESPDTFEHTWSLGGKSAQVFYVTNAQEDSELGKPWGLDGGFEEQAVYATGIFERGGKRIVMSLPHEKDGKPIDLSHYRGRWYLAIPGVPETKTKLNDKCGYVNLLHESAPVVKAVDPAMVVPVPTGKKDEVRDQLAVWTTLDADGNPLGAEYFVGLLGNWDMKKVGSFTPKGEKEEKDQKVLCLTHFEGRVGEAGAESASAASSKSTPAATAKKATPATTAAASAPAPANGTGSLEDRVRAAILEALPASGTIPVVGAGSLTLSIVKAMGIKKGDEAKAAADLIKQIVGEAPEDAEGAQSLVEMGMEVSFLHREGKVERWSA